MSDELMMKWIKSKEEIKENFKTLSLSGKSRLELPLLVISSIISSCSFMKVCFIFWDDVDE